MTFCAKDNGRDGVGDGLHYGNTGVNARTPGGLSCNFSTHAFRIPEIFAMRDVTGVASDCVLSLSLSLSLILQNCFNVII